MLNKIINSENPKYQSETISELVFDTTPTVNSFNAVTSDAVARAVAGASGEVPVVTENDNGKVLSAIYDAGGPAVEWADPPSGLPDTTGASEGDVLTLGSSGAEWATPSGGSSGYTPVDLEAITAAPFTIPVGNREDVAVTLSNGTGILTLQLANDCTDAIVKINNSLAAFTGIQVVRGQEVLDVFGMEYAVDVDVGSYGENNILASDLASDSDYDIPSDFTDCSLTGASLVNGVSALKPWNTGYKFVIEIKGRSAILHM